MAAKIAPSWSRQQSGRAHVIESDDEDEGSVDSDEAAAAAVDVEAEAEAEAKANSNGARGKPLSSASKQSLHEMAVQHAQYRAEVRDRVMKVVMTEVLPDIGAYDLDAQVVSRKSKWEGPYTTPLKLFLKFMGCWPLNLHETILTGNAGYIDKKINQIIDFCEKTNTDPKVEINCYDDKFKQTPLSMAVKTKNLDFVDMILSQGGIPDFPDMETGRTPLIFSVLHKTHYISQALIRNGASVNLCDTKCVTPLMIAAVNNDPQHCKMLCDKLADFDAQDENGMTPLHFAAYGNAADAAAYLIKQGARRDIKDMNKRKAIHLARFLNHGNAVAALEDIKTRIADAEDD